MNRPSALIMAGGTGGHVYPALAVALGLLARGWSVEWVGTTHGLEARVVPAHGITLHTLPVRGLRGKGLWARVSGLFRLLIASVAAIRLVLGLRPSVVLGMGGYASGPAGMAATLLRRPLILHEQNAVTGTANRLLAPVATRLLAGFSSAFAGHSSRQLVGNPIRAEIVTLAANAQPLPAHFDATRPLRLLVLGGSLGSRPINRAVPEALAALDDAQRQQLDVVHQCGDAHVADTQAAYGVLANLTVQVEAFIEDMAAAYGRADLVVCRSGALTVAELAASGTPAILVPLPHAIDDHQTGNARVLSDAGAGVLLPQSELSAERLAMHLGYCLSEPSTLDAMRSRAQSVAYPNATQTVIDVLQEVADAA